MAKISYSSETYMLKVDDLIKLEKAKEYKKGDEVSILLGEQRTETNDTLLSGFDILRNTKEKYIKVRVAYYTFNPIFGFFINLIKRLKRKYYVLGVNVYATPISDICSKNIERGQRTADNAYAWTNKKYAMSEEERKERYSSLYNSIKEKGYDYESPILILLNRSLGVKDQILQGHHRMNICQDLNLEEITVRFWGAPKSPDFVSVFDKVLRRLKKLLKI